MKSKKFAGLDISELDKAAALEPKPEEADPVDSKFSEWIDPASTSKSRTIQTPETIFVPKTDRKSVVMDRSEPEPMIPSMFSEPKSEPMMSSTISEPKPTVLSEPVPVRTMDPEPAGIQDSPYSSGLSEPSYAMTTPDPDVDTAEPKNKKKNKEKNKETPKGPGMLDSVPILGNLIRAVQYRRFGFLIWVILNWLITSVIFETFIESNGFLIGTGVYLAMVFIVTSPIGEFIGVLLNKWKPLKPEQQLARIEYILDIVYPQAKELTPWIKRKPKLYYDEEEFPNSMALGRGSLCVTKGLLLHCSDDEIAGILAHEMGHLANRHSDEGMIIRFGNLFIILFFTIIGIICNMVLALVSHVLDNSLTFAAIGKGLNYFFSSLLVRGWNNLGNLFTHSSSVNEEFDADAYAADLGYSRQLCDALAKIDSGSGSVSSSWAALTGDHPSIADRILRMQGK